MFSLRIICVCVFLPFFMTAASEIRYPDDAGVIDVTQPPYNAKGDGVTDDTDAINAALHDWNWRTIPRNAMSPTIYFPKGTYLVSDTLIPLDTNGLPMNSVRILGESRSETVIRLKDNTPGFRDPDSPKYLLQTGNQPVVRSGREKPGIPNSGYGNYIQNLTLDVGCGNPGAAGVRYDVANWGTLEHVDIVSSDGAGHSGISFFYVCGAGYVKDVSIRGFKYGVCFEDSTAVNNIVFEHIDLKNQTVCGILNPGKSIQIRKLTSYNSVPALISKNPWAATVLIEADLTAPERTKCAALDIRNNGFLFVRDLKTGGYTNSVSTATQTITRPNVEEWSSLSGSWNEGQNQSLTLDLPVKDSPKYHSNNFSEWASVLDYGATRNDDSDDDAAGIQAAIDSGKEVVYFPWGKYTIKSPVIVRGAVKKIDGVFSMILRPSGNRSAEIQISDVDGDCIILENITTKFIPITHNSPDTVVIRHRPHEGTIRCGAAASGDLFIEDAGPRARVELSGGVHAWIRQLNREQAGASNDGSTVWLFGDNVEGKRDGSGVFTTINGGRTELLGGALDLMHQIPDQVLFEVVDSSISVVYAGECRSQGAWGTHVKVSRDGRLVDAVSDEDIPPFIFHGGGSAARFMVPPYKSTAAQYK